MKKTAEWYKEACASTRENTKTAIRVTKLSVMGACMLTAAIPLTYMMMYEDMLNNVTDKFIRGEDIDGED